MFTRQGSQPPGNLEKSGNIVDLEKSGRSQGILFVVMENLNSYRLKLKAIVCSYYEIK